MKKVMVGIIGCGTIANSAHIPAYLKNEDVEIKYFCDIIPERAKAAVEKYGCGIAVEDYHRVLAVSYTHLDVYKRQVVQQGLILRDRIFTVSVLLPDKPGELSKVAAVVAKEHGNVIKLSHNQFVSINRSAAVELRITMESFGTEHKQEIISALEKEGYRPKVVQTNM